MKFHDFEIRKCLGVTSAHHQYELVKWTKRSGKGGTPYCFVIAWLDQDGDEWCIKSVGMRLVDYYADGLMGYIKSTVEILELMNKKSSEEDEQ